MLKITVCSIGQKMPKWLNEATSEHLKRLEHKIQIDWIELPLIKRTTSSQLSQILEKEYHSIMSAIPDKTYIIALDAQGQTFSSEKLAAKMDDLQQLHSHWCIIIGGPEGLHPKLLKHAHEKWSLSPLTFTHPLVRLVLLESIFRSWCILNNHPYHK